MSCCCEGKGQLCGEWTTKQRIAVYGTLFAVMGWAVYTGQISSDPPEQSPVLSKPSPESAAVSAVFGYTVGPLMLIYGHRIEETIVILNSLVTAGVDSFIESMQYLEDLNRDISGGRVMPGQIVNLLGIMLGAFSLSTTSLKVPKFKAMMKGGVIADLLVTAITDQIPGIDGCLCEGSPCSPVVNAAQYSIEPSCYKDKWVRWWIKYTVCGTAAIIAMKVQEMVRKWNASLLAANLCNEAIYDTSLALYPAYGLRIQPYRMFTLGMFAGFGFMSQLRLTLLDMGYDKPFCLRGMYVWLNRVGNVVMVPLMFTNRFGLAIKNLGIANEKPATKSAPIDLVTVQGRQAAWQLFKVVMLNPATSRMVLLFLNLVIFLLSCGAIAVGAAIVGSDEYSAFIDNSIVIVMMVGASFLVFTSFLGCRAGSSNTFKFLIPYSAVMLATLCMQMAGAIYIYENYGSASPAQMEGYIENKMLAQWEQGNCTAMPTVPPFNATCANPKQLWFQQFMQKGCEFKGPGDLTKIKGNLIQAMDKENENLVKYYSLKYNLVAGTKKRIYTCFDNRDLFYNETHVTDQNGLAAFCVCRSVLMSKLDSMRNLAIVGITMICVQVLLLLMSCKLMGIDLTEVAGGPGALTGGNKKITV